MTSPNPNFDTSRIADYPDKTTLATIRAYFEGFVIPNPDTMRDMQAEDYTMTDIPLCIVNVDRDTFYEINKAFVSMTTNTKVIALTIDGSVTNPPRPLPKLGDRPAPIGLLEHLPLTLLENLVEFELTMDPPPGPGRNLPPGAKKGDHVRMIMTSLMWWTPEGKIKRELEYGRLVWQDFDLHQFELPEGLKRPGQGKWNTSESMLPDTKEIGRGNYAVPMALQFPRLYEKRVFADYVSGFFKWLCL